MEYIDLLNELSVRERLRNATVSAYIVNEVNPQAFLGEGATIYPNAKVVQIRVCSLKFGGKEYFLEAWMYASIPKTVQVGDFCYLTGTITNLSKESFSKEVTLFNFSKSSETGKWGIAPCIVKSWHDSPFTDTLLVRNLEYWKQFPYTLSSGKDTIITPITRMVETEVMMDFTNTIVGNKFEFPRVSLGDLADLTQLQSDCLEEMLVAPVLQLQVENENLVSVADLVKSIKSAEGVQTVVYDLRSNGVNPKVVVDQLNAKNEIREDGKRYILLVSSVVHGIPSIVLGTECLF